MEKHTNYTHVSKAWLADQLAWNRCITDWLFAVLPRDQRGEIIPAMDAPDFVKYFKGLKLTKAAETALSSQQSNINRRSSDDSSDLLFNDLERRA
jgi:hypothetical protein